MPAILEELGTDDRSMVTGAAQVLFTHVPPFAPPAVALSTCHV